MSGAGGLRVTFIGAGSATFTRHLVTDLVAIDGLDGGTIALVDVDAGRLDLARRLAERIAAGSDGAWRVLATTERTEVLAGSDAVISCIEVAGRANVRLDYELPLRYGVDQCVADTIGPGGVFKALRTGPAWLAIARDVGRLCPDAVLLNYTNPMSILTLAALRATGLGVVGLCHSVQGTSRQLARYLEVPYEELRWRCAGINHNSWFTELRRGDDDLYPLLRARAHVPEVYEQDPVRFEVLRHLGAFVTESSGHFSEYVPYFRKRPELIARYMRPRFGGASGFYPTRWPVWVEEQLALAEEMASGRAPIPRERSREYAADIVEGLVLDRPRVVYGNVANGGLVENLPGSGCVEVACLVDRRGVQPCRFGRLPEQLAALNRAHMAVHELMVDALLRLDPEPARHALMLDPLTAAVCSLEEIDGLFDEMWAAQRAYLAPFERRR